MRVRPVALTVEQRSPKPTVGGSNPSWPVFCFAYVEAHIEEVKLFAVRRFYVGQ